MTAFSDSQLVAKANAIGSKTEENTIDPLMISAMFNDIILNKWNKDSPLPKGDKGDPGDPGDPGPSAYQAWLDLGNSGTEQDFIDSLKGDTGDPGPEGPTGPEGPQGATGPAGPEGVQGETGPAGPTGPQGVAGDTGPAGPQGDAGQQGPQGVQGETGPQGPAGADGSPDTPAEIVTKLSSISEEAEKLPTTALQGAPINGDQLGIDPVIEALYVKTDEEPTENSAKFISSGDLFAYEQANPRGGKLWPLESLREARHSMNSTGHKVVVTPTSILIGGDGSSGDGHNAMISVDGINYQKINTGYFICTGLEHANGTTILCGRNTGAGTYVCKRSLDDGRTWSDITLPVNSLPIDIATDENGTWVIACRTTGAGFPNVLYSTDDGLTWNVGAVVDETLEFYEVVCAGGNFLLVAWSGTDRYQLSTDGGETFSTVTATNDAGFFPHSAVVHRGDIFITSNSGTNGNRLLRSQDNGVSLVGISNGFDDVPIRESGVAGPYIYVSSQTGGRLFRSLTGAPGSWEEVSTGTTNEIKYVGGGIFKGEFYIVLGTSDAAEKILINI